MNLEMMTNPLSTDVPVRELTEALALAMVLKASMYTVLEEKALRL